MTTALDRALFPPVAAVRTYLVVRSTLLLLAFDMWLTRIEHGGRYGVGGFNVAHFELLDAIQPTISPGLHVGVCMATGVLCLVLAVVAHPPRALVALACVLHTWSWAMSMLDSYQHHYLLSVVLGAMVFFPRLASDEALAAPAGASQRSVSTKERGAKKSKKKRANNAPNASGGTEARAPRLRDDVRYFSGFAYPLFAWSVAIVYAFTAYAKTDPEWLTGAALQRVLQLSPGGVVRPEETDPVAPFRAIATMFGVSGETFWWAMGHSVVIVQIVCAAGYLLAPYRDMATSRLARAFSWVALAAALSFHVGAEIMDLRIGWFSAYMIGYACFAFLPARALAALARAVLVARGGEVELARVAVAVGALVVSAVTSTWAIAAVAFVLLAARPVGQFARTSSSARASERALGGAAAAAIALVGAGYTVDLPGAGVAAVALAIMLGAAVIALFVARDDAREIHPYAVGAALGATAFWASIVASDVRWDFYRNVGGDHRRRGEIREAYDAYVKANRYAPEGQDRRAREDEMRRILIERGEPVPEASEDEER